MRQVADSVVLSQSTTTRLVTRLEDRGRNISGADSDCPLSVLTWRAPVESPPDQQKETVMKLVSIRLITDDIQQMAGFYQRVLEIEPNWANADFAELTTPVGTLAIGSTRTVGLFAPGSARPADNHTAIIEFMVPDVDAEYQRLRETVDSFVNEPTTMPWGNRSLLLRDPDGNLVNLFTPVTAQAVARVGGAV